MENSKRLDLKPLSASLASSERRQDDGQIQRAFREAALSITSLLRVSQSSTNKAYENGYSDCLEDVMNVLSNSLHQHNTVQYLFNWIEARQESLKAPAEENSEDAASDTDMPARTLPSSPAQSSIAVGPPAQADFTFSCPVPSPMPSTSTAASSPAIISRSKSTSNTKRSSSKSGLAASNASRERPSAIPSILGAKRKQADQQPEVFDVLSALAGEAQHKEGDDVAMDAHSHFQPQLQVEDSFATRPAKRVSRRPQ